MEQMTFSGHSKQLGDIERHFWLTRSVARVMGISFSEALAEGHLTRSDFADLVTRCRAAGCSGFCETWLAAQADLAPRAPETCPNAAALNRLRAALETG